MTDYYSDSYVRLDDAYVISQDISVAQAAAMTHVELRMAESLGVDLNAPTFHQVYGVPVVPGLPSGPVQGEIVDPSGGVVTVPVVTLPTDYVTMTGLMDALSRGPQSHDDGRTFGRGAPVWALACLFVGLVLIGLAMVGGAWLSTQ